MLVDFCLPVKDEEKILKRSLDKLLAYLSGQDFNFSWRIVGLINGSSDNSLDIFKDFQQHYPSQILYLAVVESGRGGALKEYWRQSSADLLVYMDADLAVSLANVPALLRPLLDNSGDLVIGSRLLSAARIKRSWSREIISQSYNIISRYLLQHQISDLQCGFKAIRRAVFNELAPYLQDNSWFFDTELVILALRLGYRVREIPVDWQENRYGRRHSTVKIMRDSWRFLKNSWLFRQRLQKIK